MELKQMVYVVIENGYVTGVWNEYQDAENHVGEDGVIIPAVVDTYGERAGCETPNEVIEAMEQELQNMYSPYPDSDNEEEDEEEEKEEDDDMFTSFFADDDEEEDEENNEESKFTDSDIIRRFLDLFYELLYN